MYDLLAWIEASSLGRVMRESGPWTYALVNLAHILGIASLFGAVLVLDLRLLGLGRRLPLGPLAEAAVTVARVGFVLAVGGAAGWVGGLGAFGGFTIPLVMSFAVSDLGQRGYAIGFIVFVVLALMSMSVMWVIKYGTDIARPAPASVS